MHVTNASAPVVAAFDLDGTLTEGGSVFGWLRSIAGTPRAWGASVRLAVPLLVGAIRSSSWADNAKERLFRTLLQGRPLAAVEETSRRYALDHLARYGRAHVLARLAWHQSQGHDVVLVSASPEMYVSVIATELGAQGACGTRLAVDPLDRLTGSYLGKNCRGTEKMRRLDDWIAERHYSTAPVVYAYGNSRGDRRLLARADHPFNVGKLGRWGRLAQYPTLKA